MQGEENYGKLVTVKDGYIVCPNCGFKTTQILRPDTQAKNLRVWCRECKHVAVVDIAFGQCFLSRCR